MLNQGFASTIWLWTTIDRWQPSILAWVQGDRSSLTFEPLWKLYNALTRNCHHDRVN